MEAVREVTATEPGKGIVHRIDGSTGQTVCGRDATSWSRAVTQLQVLGLVLFCEDCQPFAAH